MPPSWIVPLVAFVGWLCLPGYFLKGMAFLPLLLLALVFAFMTVARSQRARWKEHATGTLMAFGTVCILFWDLGRSDVAARDMVYSLRDRYHCGPTYATLQRFDPGWTPLGGGGLLYRPRSPLGTEQSVRYRRSEDKAYVDSGILDAGAYGWEFPCVSPDPMVANPPAPASSPASISPPPPPPRP